MDGCQLTSLFMVVCILSYTSSHQYIYTFSVMSLLLPLASLTDAHMLRITEGRDQHNNMVQFLPNYGAISWKILLKYWQLHNCSVIWGFTLYVYFCLPIDPWPSCSVKTMTHWVQPWCTGVGGGLVTMVLDLVWSQCQQWHDACDLAPDEVTPATTSQGTITQTINLEKLRNRQGLI